MTQVVSKITKTNQHKKQNLFKMLNYKNNKFNLKQPHTIRNKKKYYKNKINQALYPLQALIVHLTLLLLQMRNKTMGLARKRQSDSI